jgi:hypothetical protein
MFTLDTTLVMIITAVVLPLLVGLVTKYNAHPAVKWIVTAFCAAAAALINTSITETGVAVISKESLVLACVTFLTTTLAYLGLYKPIDANARLAPTVGIGPSTPPAA